MRSRIVVTATLFLLVSVGCDSPTGSDLGLDGGNGDGAIAVAPDEVVVGLPKTGTLEPYMPLDQYVDIPADGTYVLLVKSLDLHVSLYTDATRTNRIVDCFADLYEAACPVTLTAGRTYVHLGSSWAFPLPYDFKLVHIVNEGTPADPVPLTSASTDHTVDVGGTSYYVFDSATAGAYDLGLGESPYGGFGPVAISLYANADFSSTPIATCPPNRVGCVVSGIPSGKIGIRVDDDSASYSIFELYPKHLLTEGAPTEPAPLTLGVARPYAIDAQTDAFYGFTTGPNAGSVDVDLTVVDTVTLFLFRADAPHTLIDTCSTTTGSCAFGGLDPSTSYVVDVASWPAQSGSITATTGLAEGSIAFPVALALGVAHDGSVENGASSYYTFTPPDPAYYEVVFTVAGSGLVDVRLWTAFGAAYPQNECTTSPCRFQGLEAGQAYGIEIAAKSPEAMYTLSVEKNPYGEGTPTHPVVLVPGVDHTGTFDDVNANTYAFTTDADGGAYGLAVHSQWTMTFQGDSALSNCTASGPVWFCNVDGLAANTVYTFSLKPPYSPPTGTPRDVTLRLLNLDGSMPCETGYTCYDFETGTMPAALTQPVGSVKPWKVSTASKNHGVYGIEAGAASPSCFEIAPPLGTFTMTFGIDFASTATSDGITAYVDSLGGWGAFASMPVVGFRRRMVAMDPATTHTVDVCFTYAGTATRHAYVDDVAIH